MELWILIFKTVAISLGVVLVLGLLGCFNLSASAWMSVTREMRRWRKRILEVLPRTDCCECGYSCCKEYAKAAVSGTEEYRPCPHCSEGHNKRIALMWVNPKEKENEETC